MYCIRFLNGCKMVEHWSEETCDQMCKHGERFALSDTDIRNNIIDAN